MRCVCIATVAFDHRSVGTISGKHIREQLPNAALYWDKLTVPVFAHGQDPSLDGDIEALEAEGCAIRWQCKDKNAYSMAEMMQFPNYVVNGLNERIANKQDEWSVLIPDVPSANIPNYQQNLLSRLGGNQTNKQTLSLAFLNALPVCQPDTSF